MMKGAGGLAGWQLSSILHVAPFGATVVVVKIIAGLFQRVQQVPFGALSLQKKKDHQCHGHPEVQVRHHLNRVGGVCAW